MKRTYPTVGQLIEQLSLLDPEEPISYIFFVSGDVIEHVIGQRPEPTPEQCKAILNHMEEYLDYANGLGLDDIDSAYDAIMGDVWIDEEEGE